MGSDASRSEFRGAVVVGVHDSERARAAMAYAALLASRLGTPLVLLHVQERDTPFVFPAVPRSGDAPPRLLGEEIDDDSLLVHRVSLTGAPSRMLVEVSEAAELLVLGRSRRRLAGSPEAGSVAQRVLDRARCPVLVVPEDR